MGCAAPSSQSPWSCFCLSWGRRQLVGGGVCPARSTRAGTSSPRPRAICLLPLNLPGHLASTLVAAHKEDQQRGQGRHRIQCDEAGSLLSTKCTLPALCRQRVRKSETGSPCTLHKQLPNSAGLTAHSFVVSQAKDKAHPQFEGLG